MGKISRWGWRAAKRYVLPRWYVETTDDVGETVLHAKRMRDFVQPDNLKQGAEKVGTGIDRAMLFKRLHRELKSRG